MKRDWWAIAAYAAMFGAVVVIIFLTTGGTR